MLSELQKAEVATYTCASLLSVISSHAPLHLKHISERSFQYSQYCESEYFLFPRGRLITHVHTCVCVCVGEGKKHINKEAEERGHSKLWNVPEVLFCQQRGNGINIFKTSIVSVAFGKKKKKEFESEKKKIPSPSGPVLLQRKHPVILYTIV